MARPLSAENKRGLRDPDTFTGRFVEFNHPDGYFRIWSHGGNIIDNQGNEWIGLGRLLEFPSVASAERPKINRVSFSISRVNNAEAEIQVGKQVRGYKGKLSLGIVNKNGRLYGDLIPIQEFELDNVEMEKMDESSILVFNGLSGLPELLIPVRKMISRNEQQNRLNELGIDLEDTGMDELAIIRSKTDLPWVVGEYEELDYTDVSPDCTVSGRRYVPDDPRFRDFIYKD